MKLFRSEYDASREGPETVIGAWVVLGCLAAAALCVLVGPWLGGR